MLMLQDISLCHPCSPLDGRIIHIGLTAQARHNLLRRVGGHHQTRTNMAAPYVTAARTALQGNIIMIIQFIGYISLRFSSNRPYV